MNPARYPYVPQRVAQNENFYFAGNRRHFEFRVPIDQTAQWAWSRHVIHLKYQGPKHTSGITEARIVKFLTK